MDIMETTQVSNDDTTQLQFTQSDFKTSSVTQEFNGIDSTTGYGNSDDVYVMALPSTTEYGSQLIINEESIEHEQPVEKSETVESSQSVEVSGFIPEEHNVEKSYEEGISNESSNCTENIDYSAISLQENVIVTTEEVITMENDSENNENEVNLNISTTESVDSALNEAETETELQESDVPNESMEEDVLPSFIGEVDESVSLPPADPPILHRDDLSVPDTSECVEEVCVSKNEIESSDDIVSANEVNVQYTILPPGENSVYQEDGTLVVEYPLDSTEDLTKNQNQDSASFVKCETVEIIQANIEADKNNEKPKPQTQEKGVAEKTPKPKGRKPSGTIPLHILGHNMEKPVEVANGKAISKPRLGVKIPYRTLTSQIVSTSELQHQIVERAKLKQDMQSQLDDSQSFAKKLTHRLAQSLSGLGRTTANKKSNDIEKQKKNEDDGIVEVPPPVNAKSTSPPVSNPENKSNIEEVSKEQNDEILSSIENIDDNVNKSLSSSDEISLTPDTLEKISESSTTSLQQGQVLVNIESNSDLIAILEGDGDEGSPIIHIPKQGSEEKDNSSEMNEIEKEISLGEQKQKLVQVPIKENKFFKSRDSRNSDATKDKAKETVSKLLNNSKDSKVSSESKSSVFKNVTVKTNSVNIQSNKNITNSEKESNMENSINNPGPKKSLTKDKGPELSNKTTTVVEVEPQLKPAMVLKTYTRKRKSNDTPTPEPPKKSLIVPTPPSNQSNQKVDCVPSVPPNVYMTKSSRIIKRKVIWDPDEAMPTVRNQTKILNKLENTVKVASPVKVTTSIKQTPTKLTEKKSEKHVEPTKSTKTVEKKTPKTANEEKIKTDSPIEKPVMKKPEKSDVLKKTKSPVAVVKSSIQIKSPITKNSIPSMQKSPNVTPGKSPKKSGKRLSEIDRLLMDEGAVNMLYDINNSDDQKRRAPHRAGTALNDKVQNQKELMNRTQEIKNELTQGSNVESSTPKALRKKESPPVVKNDGDFKDMGDISVARKMSKDSSKSSVHSPPPSPAAFTIAEASRIIRRHSSSSFSSNDELVQETLAEINDKEREKHHKKKSASSQESQRSPAGAANITQNRIKERVMKKKATTASEETPTKKARKEKSFPKEESFSEPHPPVEISVKSEPGIVTGELKTDPSKAFTIIKMNKHYMINLTYSGGDNYLSVQLLKDLTIALKELGKTRNCTVVSIHSQGPAFCLGVDYKSLVESDEHLRSKRATELSNCIRDFLKCLLSFPKVIVAGIKGDCVGLGVTMLPLFDMIVASDTANFCTPYAKLGCAPEAGFLLSIPFQCNHGLASELLYTTQRMDADEAQRRGLVTKLYWPEKFDTEFRGLLTHISNLSRVGLMATKKQLRVFHCHSTESTLISESKALINQWISEECQRNFTNYNALTFDIDQ